MLLRWFFLWLDYFLAGCWFNSGSINVMIDSLVQLGNVFSYQFNGINVIALVCSVEEVVKKLKET